MDASAGVMVSINGSIESAQFPGIDDIYCKYCYVYGTDWTVTTGTEEGISQIAKKSKDERRLFVWNFPLEITFKSSNIFGWPQLAVAVYGLDAFSNDVVRGYGAVHVPPIAGTHKRCISTFAPASSSLVHKVTSWMSGRRPEFIDPKMAARGDGREVTRTTSNGIINVAFNVVTKDLKKFGFNVGSYSSERLRGTVNVGIPF